MSAAIGVWLTLAPAAAQQQNPQQPPQGPAQQPTADQPPKPKIEIPDSALGGAISGGNEGIAALRNFLGVGSATPRQITDRAIALIQAISGQNGEIEAEKLVTAIDRITTLASQALGATRVLRVGIEPGFRPGARSLALDFGPPDVAPPEGFQKVVPGDPRVQGQGLAARRGGDAEVLGDGVAGVERIAFRLPDGAYRVMLLTQDLGDPSLTSPFGREVTVGGVRYVVNPGTTDGWVPSAVITNRGRSAINGTARSLAGVWSGRLAPGGAELAAQQRGGALILQGIATEGELVIELRSFGDARSYLSGLIVEPMDDTSQAVLSGEAGDTLGDLDERLALEGEIQLAAIEALEQIEPGSGRLPRELPEPLFDNILVTSPST